MLVLSRYVGESILIDTDEGPVEVTVVAIKSNGAVRLGIRAPETMPVHRQEVYERIREERKRD